MKNFLMSLMMVVLVQFVPHFAMAKTDSMRPSGSNESGNTGLGLMLGEPTGITYKSWLSHSRAFDLALSYSFSSYFEILGDYLWHFPNTFKGEYGDEFVPYIGVGGALFFNTASGASRASRFTASSSSASVGFGVRIPLGVEFLPHAVHDNPPIGVFVELAPGIGLIPGTYGFFQADIGIRYYF